MTTLDQFIAERAIRMDAENVDSNPHMASDPDWARSATHWRCVLRNGRKRMTVYFSQGAAHRDAPTIADVLDCIASDASGVENARDFEDWASEYGYDTDSRTAERTFTICQTQADKLRKLLGADDYEALLWNTERL